MEYYLASLADPAILFVIFAVFVVGYRIGFMSGRASGDGDQAQERIETAVNELTPRQWAPIDEEIAARRKIGAIKLLRELTGLGLKDAKHAVEARMRARLIQP